MRMKDLPKAPTWRLEWGSNPQPYGRKSMNLPLSYNSPTYMSHTCTYRPIYTAYIGLILHTCHIYAYTRQDNRVAMSRIMWFSCGIPCRPNDLVEVGTQTCLYHHAVSFNQSINQLFY